MSHAILRLRQVFSACRTPVMLFSGLALFARDDTLVRDAVVAQSHYGNVGTFFCAAPLSPDCFFYIPTSLLYVPNVVKFLAYLLMLFAVLELKCILLRGRGSVRWDGVTALVGFSLAAAPWLVLLKIEGPCARLLPFLAAYTVGLWLFIVVNAELSAVEKYVAKSRWAGRVMEWTFPVSDVLFFRFHRQRIGQESGLLRFVPALSYMAIIAVALVLEVSILTDSLRADEMPVRVLDPYLVVQDTEGFWYSEAGGALAGIWRYDARGHRAHPYLRVQDLHKFALRDGFFYFYDGYENEVLKVDARTSRVAWSVPVPRGFGTFELALTRGLIFAVGKGGHIAVIDMEGRVRTERTFSLKTWFPQALPADRIAFVSPERAHVSIVGAELADEDVVPLPLANMIAAPKNGRTEARGSAVVIASEYVERLQTLYVATLWGEIFRYDTSARRWLPSYRTQPGVRSITADSRNGFLFAYNHARGYVDVIDLESGKHLKYLLADVFGTFINVAPDAMVAILSSRGPGSTSFPRPGRMHQFDYRSIAASRSVRQAKELWPQR